MPQLEHIEAIERRLWSAADTLRANSEYASNEYFLPVMGLVRHAYSRYLAAKDEIAAGLPTRGGRKRAVTREDFPQKNAIFLRPGARFDYLVALTDGEDRAAAVIAAMESIEDDYDSLRGILPKSEYQALNNDVLGDLLRKLNPEELRHADGDVFGRSTSTSSRSSPTRRPTTAASSSPPCRSSRSSPTCSTPTAAPCSIRPAAPAEPAIDVSEHWVTVTFPRPANRDVEGTDPAARRATPETDGEFPESVRRAQEGGQEAQEGGQEAQEGGQEAQATAEQRRAKSNEGRLQNWEIAVLRACVEQPATGRELLAASGYSTRTGNFKRAVERHLAMNLLELTIPDKPRSGKQRYRLTAAGRRVLAGLAEGKE